MLMSLVSHAVSAWFAFLLPCYATFKALSHRPLSEPELQRWSMYWTVIGAFVAFEYLGEWLISWLPFYWEIKTLFLLFLSLPQTEGSTYIYTTYLQPFFAKHEADLDAGIISIQRNVFAFMQARLVVLWEFAWSVINKAPASRQPASSASPTAPTGPALSLQSAMALWKSYSPWMNSAPQPSGATEPGVRTAGDQRAAPVAKNDINLPNPFESTPPSFPEPQHS
ncbi:TB2/DP1, HVA22 family-domain-containing protein [Lyophyllum atratum]|nr:TB2/DP1, HVA22 family-domain-containing protein [Lyophyllum atratum]